MLHHEHQFQIYAFLPAQQPHPPASPRKPVFRSTVMILSFWTDMPGQKVQTQIRLRSSLIRVYTVCHSVCIVWTHYSMVEPHSSNFRVITTNFWGVRIFSKFTVTISEDLKWNSHINKISKKANSTIVFLNRNLKHCLLGYRKTC